MNEDDVLVVREGRQGSLGEMTVGAMNVWSSPFRKGKARVQVSFEDKDGAWSATIEVEPGTLIPSTAGLHRVIRIKGDSVAIARTPERVAGLSPRRGVVLFLGGVTTIRDDDLVLVELGEPDRARIVTWDRRKGNDDKEYTEKAGITVRSDVSSGNALRVGQNRYRVETIVPTDRATGVVGWVDLSVAN